MKKSTLTFCFFLLVFEFGFSQNPLVKQWDYRFGGMIHDFLWSFQETSDGGYILGGISWSGIGGDKTQNNRDTTLLSTDYWIVKIDSLGNKQWDKDFGGTAYDYLYSLQQTSDCCDQYNNLYDDECNFICAPDGGISGGGDGKCGDFHDKKTNEKIIWQDSR